MSIDSNYISKEGYLTSHIADNHPTFNLIPIRSSDLFTNAELIQHSSPEGTGQSKLQSLYGDRFLGYTAKGRSALDTILRDIGLKKSDTVAIYTTSANHYISSCVTNTIEGHCNWERERIGESTKAILVNHEFGYLYNETKLLELKKLGIPLIEDCAYALGLKHPSGMLAGMLGDYALFSLSKCFPMQIGGFYLASKDLGTDLGGNDEGYVKALSTHYADQLEEIHTQRMSKFHEFCEILLPLGIKPHLARNSTDLPAVMLFSWSGFTDWIGLKSHLQSMGIICSVFYGQEAFYIPCHQHSERGYMEMIRDILQAYNG